MIAVRVIIRTAREQEIVARVRQNDTYAAIGAALGMSPETARVHVNRIASRLPDDGLPAYRRVRRWVLDEEAPDGTVYTPVDARSTRGP